MLSETIKKARMSSCLTQKEMADFLNLSKSNYLRKENSYTEFKRDEVLKLSMILKLDANQLLTFWMVDKIKRITETDKKIGEAALKIIMKRNFC